MTDADAPNPPTVPGPVGLTRRQFRSAIALIMVAVATCGAVTAFWAARAEQHATSLRLRFTVGRLLETARWTEYIGQYGIVASLGERNREHRERGLDLAERADALRKTNAARARELDGQAQEEFALGRIFTGFMYFMKRPDSKVLIAESLANDVIADLRELGFGTGETRPEKPGPPASPSVGPPRALDGFWQGLRGLIDADHETVRYLSLAVVGFVAALVCFTFADLLIRRRRLAEVLTALGLIATAASLGTAVKHDRPFGWAFAAILGLFVVVFLLAWRNGAFDARRAEPEASGHVPERPHPELEGRSQRFAHLPLREAPDPFSLRLILLIAFTVLVSTGVGYVYSVTATQMQHLADQAFVSQVQLIERTTQSSITAIVGAFESGGAPLAARIRCSSATQRESLGFTGTKNERDIYCSVLETKDSLKQAASMMGDWSFDTAYGPGKEMYSWLVSSLGGDPKSGANTPAYLYALVDGLEESAAALNRKTVVYLAALTAFAIALYLFGQALAVGPGWEAKTFIRFGVVFVLAALGYAGVTYADIHLGPELWSRRADPGAGTAGPCKDATAQDEHSEEAAIKRAARHFGEGERNLILAPLGHDDAERSARYTKAAEALGCAVRARPRFQRAHALLARAYSRMKTPQRDDEYLSLPTRSKVREIIQARADARASSERSGFGASRHDLPADSGFNYWLLALRDGDRKALRQSLKVLEKVAKADGVRASRVKAALGMGASSAGKREHRVDYLNLALGLLAANRADEAMPLYRRVIDDLQLADSKALLHATLTDLALFEKYCPNLRSAGECRSLRETVSGLKPRLIRGKWEPLAPPSDARLSNVSAWVTPAESGWRGTLRPGTAPGNRDELTVIWYALGDDHDKDSQEWGVRRAIPALSNTVKLSALKPGPDGSVRWVEPFLGNTNECVPAGQYVAEFYLNGVPMPELATRAVTVKKFVAYRSRELNVVGCLPEGWSVATAAWKPELYRILFTPAKQPAAVLMTFYGPRDQPEERLMTEYLQIISRYVARNRWANMERLAECDGATPEGSPVHKEWVTSEGFVHVAVVLPVADRETICHVQASWTNHYTPGKLRAAK